MSATDTFLVGLIVAGFTIAGFTLGLNTPKANSESPP